MKDMSDFSTISKIHTETWWKIMVYDVFGINEFSVPFLTQINYLTETPLQIQIYYFEFN